MAITFGQFKAGILEAPNRLAKSGALFGVINGQVQCQFHRPNRC